MEQVQSQCKRLDHKTIQFRTPTFKSYDCNGRICSDFRPSPNYKFFYNNWHDRYIRFYVPKEHETIALRVKGESEVDYHVSYLDFFNNTFKNEDGSLKWLYKEYYIQSRYSPFGYLLIKEFPDGTFGRAGKVYKDKNELTAEQKEIRRNSMLDFSFTNLLITSLRKSKIHNKRLDELKSDCLPHILNYINQKMKKEKR
jgi:hypothetical protein